VVTFTIQKRAIPMVTFLPIRPLRNCLTLGPARYAVPRKICSKKFSEIENFGICGLRNCYFLNSPIREFFNLLMTKSLNPSNRQLAMPGGSVPLPIELYTHYPSVAAHLPRQLLQRSSPALQRASVPVRSFQHPLPATEMRPLLPEPRVPLPCNHYRSSPGVLHSLNYPRRKGEGF